MNSAGSGLLTGPLAKVSLLWTATGKLGGEIMKGGRPRGLWDAVKLYPSFLGLICPQSEWRQGQGMQ